MSTLKKITESDWENIFTAFYKHSNIYRTGQTFDDFKTFAKNECVSPTMDNNEGNTFDIETCNECGKPLKGAEIKKGVCDKCDV